MVSSVENEASFSFKCITADDLSIRFDIKNKTQ